MKERKDIRDCHYGLYPAVTFAIIGLMAAGVYLEVQLYTKREEVIEAYQEFYDKYDWETIVEEGCSSYRKN